MAARESSPSPSSGQQKSPPSSAPSKDAAPSSSSSSQKPPKSLSSSSASKSAASTASCSPPPSGAASSPTTVILGLRPLAQLQKCVTQDEGRVTTTYLDQEEVESQILEIYLKCSKNAQKFKDFEVLLQRDKHIAFLKRGLKQLSDAYEALDASRPWLCYWILHSLNLLGVSLSKEECSQISQFLEKCQDPTTGGFGGGPLQMSHLAATYAAINALVSLGTLDALSVVNRESLLNFVVSMKLPDGSFRMHRGGEIDVRAVYCAIVVAKITNIQLPAKDLFEGTAEWILTCQTYEGGFGGCPGMEAHGGYTFCAVAALILLGKLRLVNEEALLRWLLCRQMAVEGGFQGRTNKLVDGCYSFWQGACFCLLGPMLREAWVEERKRPRVDGNAEHEHEQGYMHEWMCSSGALQEYILVCCQHSLGGLIDKPGKQRDYYHTCYTLSGLSAVQHQPNGHKQILGNPSNELKKINPVFNLTEDCVERALDFYFNSSGIASSSTAATAESELGSTSPAAAAASAASAALSSSSSEDSFHNTVTSQSTAPATTAAAADQVPSSSPSPSKSPPTSS